MAKKDTLKVQGTNKSGRVAFFEKDEAHPNGEAFVVHDGRVHEIGKTAAAKSALSRGELTTEIDEDAIPEVPPLRPATSQEEASAEPPVTGETDKATAEVPVFPAGINRGGRPPKGK